MENFFDIRRIGPYVRTFSDIDASNSVLVDGPFKSYDAAAAQADHMNKSRANENSPRFIAVPRK
jgi:hypothetical protein